MTPFFISEGLEMLEISEAGGRGWTPQEHDRVERGKQPTRPSCVPRPRATGTCHAHSSSPLSPPASLPKPRGMVPL